MINESWIPTILTGRLNSRCYRIERFLTNPLTPAHMLKLFEFECPRKVVRVLYLQRVCFNCFIYSSCISRCPKFNSRNFLYHRLYMDMGFFYFLTFGERCYTLYHRSVNAQRRCGSYGIRNKRLNMIVQTVPLT